MRVARGGRAVGRPARVPNAGRAAERRLVNQIDELRKLAGVLADFEAGHRV